MLTSVEKDADGQYPAAQIDGVRVLRKEHRATRMTEGRTLFEVFMATIDLEKSFFLQRPKPLRVQQPHGEVRETVQPLMAQQLEAMRAIF